MYIKILQEWIRTLKNKFFIFKNKNNFLNILYTPNISFEYNIVGISNNSNQLELFKICNDDEYSDSDIELSY